MFISTYEELERFCERASSYPVLAVDTEFLRERTYRPKLCLIQLATSADDIVAVDPIAITDLTPIARLFKDPSIVKVIHACSQDLEVIDGAMGCVPTPMFDTQLAAAFLGHRMQLGYGALVRYLPGIYEQMRAKLIERDRLSMVLPEMQALLDPSHYRHDPMWAYLHLKRVSSLTKRQLAVAREACAWREKLAAKRDIPRKWVLSDEVLVEVCRRMPADEQRLRRIRGTEQLSERDSAALLHAVSRGLSCPADKYPSVPRRSRPSGEQESVVDLMYAMLRIISERTGVATQLIATRDELLEFMSGADGAALGQGWRYELAGRQLEGLLSGSCGLTVKDGRVEIL